MESSSHPQRSPTNYFRLGNQQDVQTKPVAGVAMIGGGSDLDEAFRWRSPRRIDEIIAEVFDPALNPQGFLRSTPRKYVRKRIEHTHDVIELLSQKISLRMIWGVTLDFVPHVAGRVTQTVQWHRTARSALAEMVPRALKCFDSIPDLLAIERLFMHEEQHPQWGDLYNTPEIALAYAFYLAKIGKEGNARAYMAEWLKRSRRRPETNQRPRELFENAVRRPLYGQLTTE